MNPILEKFGEFLVNEIRDKTINDWDRVITGQMKGRTAEQVQQEISAFTPQQKEIVQRLLPRIVDSTLHNLLFKIDQQKNLQLIMSDTPDKAHDLKSLSDGLAGELYGNRGWIARFSNKVPGST